MPNILVPRERRPGETRVAATPETVKRMVKEGFHVTIEAGAGAAAFFPDADYEAAGATVTSAPDWKPADVVLRVAAPDAAETAPPELSQLHPGALLISFLAPHRNLAAVRQLAEGNVTSLAMEL